MAGISTSVAVNSAGIIDGSIVNADINASAAIDPTKIALVQVIAQGSGNPAATTAGNPFIFPTVDINSVGTAYSTSTGRYTVPAGYDGIYKVSIQGDATGAGNATVYVHKNTSQGPNIANFKLASLFVVGQACIAAVAGDVLDVRPNVDMNIADGTIIFERVGR